MSKIISCIIIMILMIIIGIISYILTVEILKKQVLSITLNDLGLKEQSTLNIYYNINYFKQLIYIIGINALFIYLVYSLVLITKAKFLISGTLIIYFILCPIFTVWDIRNQMFNVSMNIFDLSLSTFIIGEMFKLDRDIFKHMTITILMIIMITTLLLILGKKKLFRMVNRS